MPKLPKQSNQDGGKQADRRQRDQAERSAMRSSLHIRLPRPTVVKSPSPLGDLMWELPNPRHRRKSNPASIQGAVHQSASNKPLDSHRSNSHLEIKHHGTTLGATLVPNHLDDCSRYVKFEEVVIMRKKNL